MMMNTSRVRQIILMIVLMSWVLVSCAQVRVGTIPTPAPSSKLRVLIMPVSGKAPEAGWPVSHATFKNNQMQAIGHFLQASGIYDVIPQNDIDKVLGGQDIPDWQWLKDDLALLRRVGKALHADYTILSIRNTISFRDLESQVVCLNLATGMQYKNSFYYNFSHMTKASAFSVHRALFKRHYQKMFMDLKSDFLATAIQKGRALPAEEAKPPVPKDKSPSGERPDQKTADSKIATVVKAPISRPPVKLTDEEIRDSDTGPTPSKKAFKPAASPPQLPLVKERPDLQGERGKRDALKSKLVVYDFETSEHLNVVALILAEALREELFSLGYFTLVDREYMQQALKEIHLQQSGLVDEKQAVQLGKWLAANEAVSGRLSTLGRSYILQVKRTDIKTLGTLGLGLLKCEAGREEELLSGIPDLARKLTGEKK